MLVKRNACVSKENPLRVNEIENFAKNVEVGETVPTIIRIKEWSLGSGSNFKYVEKFARVRILNKYKHIVEYEYDTATGVKTDTMRWADFVIGHYKNAGMVVLEEKEQPGRAA